MSLLFVLGWGAFFTVLAVLTIGGLLAELNGPASQDRDATGEGP